MNERVIHAIKKRRGIGLSQLNSGGTVTCFVAIGDGRERMLVLLRCQTESVIVVDKCLHFFLAIIKSPVDLGQETELRIEIVC